MNKKFFILILPLIFALGFFVRFWQLETIPPELQYDEDYNGIVALKAKESGNYKLFYPENNDREGIYHNIIALIFEVLPENNFGLRMTSAIFGSLTLIGFFFLLRVLQFSPIVQLLATFMLSTSFWHLNFSRTVDPGIMVPTLLVWIFFFFYKSLKQKENKWLRWLWISTSGLLVGIGFHTHISFCVVPLILIVLLPFFVMRNNHFLRQRISSVLLFILAALLVAAPLFYYFYQHPADFSNRSNDVSVINREEPVQTMLNLGFSLITHLGAFLVFGDANQYHNHEAMPLLPLAWGLIFVFGFVLSLKRINRYIHERKTTEISGYLDACILGQIIFWVMLIPGILIIEGAPHSLRIIGAIPGVFLLIAVALEFFHRLYGKLNTPKEIESLPSNKQKLFRHAFLAIIAIILMSGFLQVKIYFFDWAKNQETTESFERELYDPGLVVKEIQPKETN